MAEQLSPAVTRAMTERNGVVSFSEQEVKTALLRLAANFGRSKPASEQLAEEGIDVSADVLKKWRTRSFPRLYLRCQGEMSKELGEGTAANLSEVANEAIEATSLYVAKSVEKADKVPAEHLAKNAQALATVAEKAIERVHVLRHEPNEIIETRDVGEMFKELERLGVAKKVDVEAEAEELD